MPHRHLMVGLFLSCASLAIPFASGSDSADPEGNFLTRSRQLTFEGRRAGEGYFSADGKRLVFQSERDPANPFYQIYELDLESGESRRISNGVGKTTCAYYVGQGYNILYASTHHDSRSAELQAEELAIRASGKERRYTWDYDPEMEIYITQSDGSETRLTQARGYDAEGSSSPDGKWIVFTSNRHAYTAHDASSDERKQLETDPAFFNEIYRMRVDGSAVQRLTRVDGYDGGPFYGADGKSIFWRRFDTSGLIADIWTMDADGGTPRPITDFASMSWAPFPHPSGEYVIFTSNKHGFANFELFIVDMAGKKEPVRVTYTDGFDGLPVPSPDGKKLIWTSMRRSKDRGGAQLFIADWNHIGALKQLREAPDRGVQ